MNTTPLNPLSRTNGRAIPLKRSSLTSGRWMPLLVMLLPLLLAGCGVYRSEVVNQNPIASGEFITVVQQAVDEYVKSQGVPPIKNKEQETPVYEKYQVDFNKLKGRGLISTVPANAFENGGTAIYVLVTPETKPTVKMMDLTSYQKLVDLQKEVDAYIGKTKSVPKADVVNPGFYLLDFKKLGIKEFQIPSPYSRTYLGILIDENGKVGIDYSPEIMKAMQKKNVAEAAPGTDLREYLVETAYFVPARSFPYHWINSQPTLAEQ